MVAINQEAYDTFWYFINERHRIALNKVTGRPKPWSDDPIFQNWKFCNVFRADDKQSAWLIENVIEPRQTWPTGQGILLFNLYAFRAFNWYETYDLLTNAQSGWINPWNENRAKTMLSSLVHSGHQLTSGAYMIRGMQGRPKYESIPEVLTQVWAVKDNLASMVGSTDRMQVAYEYLMSQKFYGWGPFTTYQILLDLTYTPILHEPEDINKWCVFGPGAKRGLRLIYPDLESKWFLKATQELWGMQDAGYYRQPHVPKMTLQDIEFCLCELSKYMRIKRGGKSKEKYDGR